MGGGGRVARPACEQCAIAVTGLVQSRVATCTAERRSAQRTGGCGRLFARAMRVERRAGAQDTVRAPMIS